MERRSQRYRTGIRAAAAQCGHIAKGIDPLKTCHDNNISLVQFRLNALLGNFSDARIGIGVIGLNSHLPSRQRNDRKAALFHRHGAQRNGNLLTRRQKHIQLVLGSLRIDLVCFCDQIIGCVALRSVKSKLLKSLS